MKIRITDEGITVICSDSGKYLIKGESFSNTEIYLGKNDCPENWQEIEEKDIPIEEIEENLNTIL